MCEAKPGPRCADDTRSQADAAVRAYAAAHPDGPAVDPATRTATASAHATPRETLEALRSRHPGVTMHLSHVEGVVTLSQIKVNDAERGSGRATAAMTDLVATADANGWTVALTPDGSYGASVPRLRAFYARFGFVPNKGRHKDFRTRETYLREPTGT